MIINEELFALEDQAVEVLEELKKSASFTDYKKAKNAMNNCAEVKAIKADFQKAKRDFEQIAEYGAFRLEYQEKQRAARKAKRVLDLNDKVAAFRLEETTLQTLLDSICLYLAETVSKEIKVTAGNPFFATNKSHCGGNCHGK